MRKKDNKKKTAEVNNTEAITNETADIEVKVSETVPAGDATGTPEDGEADSADTEKATDGEKDDEKKKEDKPPKKYRWFRFAQFEFDPETGDDFKFNEDKIKQALEHLSIHKWAYVLHDKDIYSENDEKKAIADGKKHVKAGEFKPRHWHVVIYVPGKATIATIARWFNVPKFFVHYIRGGNKGFLDCVEYLTHEKVSDKTIYPDECIVANFAWRDEVDDKNLHPAKYDKDDMSPRDKMIYEVRNFGKSLKECEYEDPFTYALYEQAIKKARINWLNDAPSPPIRINYYLDGKGGIGKGALSRGIARSLFKDIDDDDDIFFCVGGNGAWFDGYNGQPVLIWNDRRAADFIKDFGGRGNVFDILDPFPEGQGRQNIKYGSINLINSVNIINGIEPYEKFLDGLAGEYTDRCGVHYNAEDKDQAYRRIPFIVCVHEEDFELFVNKGFEENSKDFQEYTAYGKIKCNLQKTKALLHGDREATREIEKGILEPIVFKYREIVDNKTVDDKSALEKVEYIFNELGYGSYTRSWTKDERKLMIDKIEYQKEITALTEKLKDFRLNGDERNSEFTREKIIYLKNQIKDVDAVLEKIGFFNDFPKTDNEADEKQKDLFAVMVESYIEAGETADAGDTSKNEGKGDGTADTTGKVETDFLGNPIDNNDDTDEGFFADEPESDD